MEIMKVFSSYDDYGYEDERLYSVLMTEDEVALYSEFQNEFADKRAENEYLGDRKKVLEFAHGKPTGKFADRSKEDEDYQEFYETGKLRTRRKVKEAAKLGALNGIIGAGIGGHAIGGKKGVAIGAAIGAAGGAGLSYGLNKAGEKYAKKKLSEDPHFYDADKEYLKYKHGNSTKNKVEKEIRKEYRRNNK